MLNGNKLVLSPDANAENAISPALRAFADWLLENPQTIEVIAAINAILFDVECTARNLHDGEMELEPRELDSGTWFLVRVSGLPAELERGGLIAFPKSIKAVVGDAQNGSGQATGDSPIGSGQIN